MKSVGTFLFFWAALSLFSFAQNSADVSETDTLTVQYSPNHRQLDFKDLDYYGLNGFQNYRPIGSRHLPWARSSNFVLPMHSYEAGLQDWNLNSHLGAYLPWTLNGDSIRYYRMSRPFTQLKYANGAEAEQFFSAFHSQNLGEGLNISFQYDRMTSEGFFTRQLTNHTRFHATYNLQSRNSRFKSRGYFLINNLEAQENGGIFLSESDDPDGNTALLDINLRDAQNRVRSQSVYFDNSYELLQRDSNYNWVTVLHRFEWSKAFRNYNDGALSDTNNLYDQFYLSQSNTFDSTYAEELSNTIGLEFLDQRLFVGYKRSEFLYFQNYLTNTEFSSDFVQAEFKDTLFDQAISAVFEKGISGFHRNELDFLGKVDFEQWKSLKTSAFIKLSQKQPDYFLERQRANHAYYNNDLNTVNQQAIGGRFSDSLTGINLQISYSQISNYTYFDSLKAVNQNSSQIEILKAEVSKQFTFFRHWNLFNRLVYQSISNEEVIPLPQLYSFHSFYYQNRFFKESLRLQAGVDLYFVGEYQGYAYSPYLAQMHLKSRENKLGNINQLDLFLNLGINKSARIFVKYENVLNSAFNEETYRIQDYPIPGRALKFGLSWRMIN